MWSQMRKRALQAGSETAWYAVEAPNIITIPIRNSTVPRI